MLDVTQPLSSEQEKETSKRKIMEHFESNVAQSREPCTQAWGVAEENQQFVQGKQWSDEVRMKRKETKRPLFSMNDIALAVNALSGREMTARFEPSYIGRSDSDRQWADVCRRFTRKLRDDCRSEHVESDKFRDLNVDNYAFLEWRQTYDGDLKGRTEVVGYDLWNMMWDSAATKQCLTDRGWDCWGGFYGIDEYLMMFPQDAARIRERMTNAGEKWAGWIVESDQKVTRWPWLHRAQYGRYINKRKKEIFLCDYHWREREQCWWTYVPAGLDPHPFGSEQWAQLDEQLMSTMGVSLAQIPPEQQAQYGVPPAKQMSFGPDEWQRYLEDYAAWATENDAVGEPAALGPDEGTYRWSYRRAVIVGDEVVKDWKLPYSRFPRMCMTGFPFKQPSGTTFYGLVDLMKDPQRFKNFTYSMAVSLMQRSTKGGMIAHPAMFDDWSNVEAKLSEPYPILRTSASARLDGSMHQFIQVNPYPSGVDGLLQLAESAAWRPTGMNPNTLGGLQDPRRVSGTVFQSLSEAVTQVLAYPFDSLRYYRQESGRLLLEIMDAHYDEEDVQRVVGEEDAQFVKPKSDWKEALQLDVIVEEINVSKSERERAWDYGSRQGTWEKLLQQGLMPPKQFVNMLPDGWVTEKDRADWVAFLEQKEQAEQAAQQAPPPEGGEPPPSGG